MNITYREAKRILSKQEEAREVINSYRGMETLGKRLQLKNNKELILKLFEIESDESILEVFTHLKAMYEEQWGDAETMPPPESPGFVEDERDEVRNLQDEASSSQEVWKKPKFYFKYTPAFFNEEVNLFKVLLAIFLMR